MTAEPSRRHVDSYRTGYRIRTDSSRVLYAGPCAAPATRWFLLITTTCKVPGWNAQCKFRHLQPLTAHMHAGVTICSCELSRDLCCVLCACFVRELMLFDVAELANLEGIPGSLSTLGDQAEDVYKPR